MLGVATPTSGESFLAVMSSITSADESGEKLAVLLIVGGGVVVWLYVVFVPSLKDDLLQFLRSVFTRTLESLTSLAIRALGSFPWVNTNGRSLSFDASLKKSG